MRDAETSAMHAGEVAQDAALPQHLSEARDRAVAQAVREVEVIAAMLRRETADLADFADAEYLLPGNLMRVEALGWALTVLTGPSRDCPGDIAEQYSIVFGKPLEVDHA